MHKKIHVVIPMSGQGTRYAAVGYKQPKPLIPINGTPMIEKLLSNFSKDWQYHFILAENHKASGLVEVLNTIAPTAAIYFIGPHKAGPSYAMRGHLSNIPAEDPVLVSYCDYGMNWDFKSFEDFVLSSECDACLISYRGFHAHYLSKVNYAFSRLDGERVVEVREKGNFTDNRENEFASGGAYYFRTRKMLEEAIDFQMKEKLEINGEFYTSLTVEALLRIKPDAHVRVFEVPGFYQWGTPDDLKDFEYWEETYSRLNCILGQKRPQVDQVLMPMAGFGSRFQDVIKQPKPLIEIDNKPMFIRALDSLPSAEKNVFVTRNDILSSIKTLNEKGYIYRGLDYVPEGQALTTELGLEVLDAQKEVLVSACDHGIVLSPAKWVQFKDKNYDAAIFTVKGFPGVRRKPLAYSYVDAGAGEFSEVKRVSVKKPVTDQASLDHLLVGTFWFKSAELLRASIEELKNENARVNGELYLDAVFNNMVKKGLRVCVIELDGYINWGDPDSLKEALYWQEIFMGHRLSIRHPFPGVKI